MASKKATESFPICINKWKSIELFSHPSPGMSEPWLIIDFKKYDVYSASIDVMYIGWEKCIWRHVGLLALINDDDNNNKDFSNNKFFCIAHL